MDLVRRKCPGDAIAFMNPKLIREKGQSLLSLISTLSAHGSARVLRRGRNRLNSDQNRQRPYAAEDGRKPHGSQKAPHDLLLDVNSFAGVVQTFTQI